MTEITERLQAVAIHLDGQAAMARGNDKRDIRHAAAMLRCLAQYAPAMCWESWHNKAEWAMADIVGAVIVERIGPRGSNRVWATNGNDVARQACAFMHDIGDALRAAHGVGSPSRQRH